MVGFCQTLKAKKQLPRSTSPKPQCHQNIGLSCDQFMVVRCLWQIHIFRLQTNTFSKWNIMEHHLQQEVSLMGFFLFQLSWLSLPPHFSRETENANATLTTKPLPLCRLPTVFRSFRNGKCSCQKWLEVEGCPKKVLRWNLLKKNGTFLKRSFLKRFHAKFVVGVNHQRSIYI